MRISSCVDRVTDSAGEGGKQARIVAMPCPGPKDVHARTARAPESGEAKLPLGVGVVKGDHVACFPANRMALVPTGDARPGGGKVVHRGRFHNVPPRSERERVTTARS